MVRVAAYKLTGSGSAERAAGIGRSKPYVYSVSKTVSPTPNRIKLFGRGCGGDFFPEKSFPRENQNKLSRKTSARSRGQTAGKPALTPFGRANSLTVYSSQKYTRRYKT